MARRYKSNLIFKGKISLKKLVILTIALIVVELLALYVFLLPINIQSADFWSLHAVVICIFFIFFSISFKDFAKNRVVYNKFTVVLGTIVALGVVVGIVGNISTAAIFNAHRYASLIDIEDTEFEKVLEASEQVNNIALMDTSSARVVGQRAIGSLSDVVSQYEISDEYNQIAYNGKPMKVATLEYAGFFKWFNNKKNGIPGYVLVDAVNFEAEYVKLEQPIKYTTSGYLGDNLQRHLRFQYPTAIFGGYYFELDEEGNPYYICPVLTAKVGLFGGYDVKGVVICNPCTGDSEYHAVDDIPNWVDRVYDGDLIVKKYNWRGMLADGYWNSIIGQKDCKKATADYGYKVMDNDVWIYTGITSVIEDSSNIGFIMVNSRTCEAKYFKVAGAEEFSAMNAAEGQVQNLGYKAAFPSLINIDGRPTYFMVLKDKGNLVKQYALVDVKKYSIVANATTQKEVLSIYRKLLKENNIFAADNKDKLEDLYQSAQITVKDIKYINLEDGTFVYITAEDGTVYKEMFAADETLVFIQEGDNIEIYYEENEDTKIREIESWNMISEQ